VVSFKRLHLVFGAILIALASAIATIELRPALAAGGPLQYADVCVGEKKITPPVPGSAAVVGIFPNVGTATCTAPQTPARVFFQ